MYNCFTRPLLVLTEVKKMLSPLKIIEMERASRA